MNVFEVILTQFNLTPNRQRIALLKFVLTRRTGLFSLAELKRECHCTLSEEEILVSVQLFEKQNLIQRYYEDQSTQGYLNDVSTYFMCAH